MAAISTLGISPAADFAVKALTATLQDHARQDIPKDTKEKKID